MQAVDAWALLTRATPEQRHFVASVAQVATPLAEGAQKLTCITSSWNRYQP